MTAHAPSASLKGLRVGALESRRRGDMDRLIHQHGGEPFLAPALREVPLRENREAFDLAHLLKEGALDTLILMTGGGTKVLFDVFYDALPGSALKESLMRVRMLTRGPKPAAALRDRGFEPSTSVPGPGTWRDVLKAIDAGPSVEGKTVAVQESGEPNRLLLSELTARGARVVSVPVYRARLPEDTAPLRELIERIIGGELDVLVVTNSTQVEHLVAVAREAGRAQELRRALSNIVVASIGPSCSETLRSFGWPVDIEAAAPLMDALLADTAKRARERLDEKRAARIVVSERGRAPRPADAPLYNSVFLKACRREATERTPIWLMRQAGRYMKEYRELRARVSFIDLCKSADLSAEVTVDAAHRLGVDAAIIFSDLLPILESLGFKLTYEKDEGPVIHNPFREEKDLTRVKPFDPESMDYVYRAIRAARAALKPDLPLIGFAGAPFTMASYLIEGGSSRNFVKTKSLMHNAPDVWNALLGRITDATIAYVNAQAEAGAQAIQFFDSWVGCLSPEDFRRHALPHTRRLIAGVTPGVPVISFGTQTNGLLPLFREAGGDVIGVDWRIELDEAWEILGDVAIQGNMDPVLLFSRPDEIRAQARRILNQAAGRPGHIFNLGHGILPETPIDNVMALVEAVKGYRKEAS